MKSEGIKTLKPLAKETSCLNLSTSDLQKLSKKFSKGKKIAIYNK